MKIVVLAGGNSTEREVSIASGQGICKALRERNHRAIMIDPYFGRETLEEDLFPAEYDIEKEAEQMHRNSAGLEATMAPMYCRYVKKQTLYFWLFMVPTERMERCSLCWT